MPELENLPVPRRAELEKPYRRPFRFVLALTWRGQPLLRRYTYLATALLVGGSIGVAAGQPLLGLVSGLGATLIYFIAAGWLWSAARQGWRLRRAWAQKSELATVRARRPQAGSEDQELAHDQFAVTVEDDGWLLTWRFRPLAIDQHPEDDEIEVPGRPRWGAKAIEDRAFDIRDAAVAAEQLVTAQEAAAEREEAAATAARGGIADAAEHAELAEEARSTAAALQRTTGQRSRREGRRGRRDR